MIITPLPAPEVRGVPVRTFEVKPLLGAKRHQGRDHCEWNTDREYCKGLQLIRHTTLARIPCSRRKEHGKSAD